jgi:hypothetical protein
LQRKPLVEINMPTRSREAVKPARRLSWSVLPLSQGCSLRRGLHPQFQAGQESILTGFTPVESSRLRREFNGAGTINRMKRVFVVLF